MKEILKILIEKYDYINKRNKLINKIINYFLINMDLNIYGDDSDPLKEIISDQENENILKIHEKDFKFFINLLYNREVIENKNLGDEDTSEYIISKEEFIWYVINTKNIASTKTTDNLTINEMNVLFLLQKLNMVDDTTENTMIEIREIIKNLDTSYIFDMYITYLDIEHAEHTDFQDSIIEYIKDINSDENLVRKIKNFQYYITTIKPITGHIDSLRSDYEKKQIFMKENILEYLTPQNILLLYCELLMEKKKYLKTKDHFFGGKTPNQSLSGHYIEFFKKYKKKSFLRYSKNDLGIKVTGIVYGRMKNIYF